MAGFHDVLPHWGGRVCMHTQGVGEPWGVVQQLPSTLRAVVPHEGARYVEVCMCILFLTTACFRSRSLTTPTPPNPDNTTP